MIDLGANPAHPIPVSFVIWAYVAWLVYVLARKGFELSLKSSVLCTVAVFPITACYGLSAHQRFEQNRIRFIEIRANDLILKSDDPHAASHVVLRTEIKSTKVRVEGKRECSVSLETTDGMIFVMMPQRDDRQCNALQLQIMSAR